MDPKGWSTGRLFREHCSFINGVFVKDMSQIGRPEKDVIIIDNSPTSYMLQPECAFPILSWYNDMTDRLLFQYVPLLIEIAKINDVRDAIPHFCQNNIINMPQAMQLCSSIFNKGNSKRMPVYRDQAKGEN
jgi:TFIIF-interacting CTD phosphatase-like protein